MLCVKIPRNKGTGRINISLKRVTILKNIFKHAEILLPKDGTDMQKWCALACDQFTSEPEYWQNAEAFVKDAPSTLHITLPEVYLGKAGVDRRIEDIHKNMAEYVKKYIYSK